MKYTTQQKSNFLSNYERNTLLKLVFACGVGYVLLHLVKILVFMWGQIPVVESTAFFHNEILPNFAIQPLEGMLKRPWTLLSFMFTGLGFFKLLSSLIWLFVFGSVVQGLIGKRELLPLFFASNILAGLAFILLQIPFPQGGLSAYFVGPDAAILAFGSAALTIAPKYKFYLGENLGIPLWVLFVIYLLLSFGTMGHFSNYPLLGLMITGIVVGFVYINLARRGFRPGNFWNNLFNKSSNKESFNRKSKAESLDVDTILDKINKKGIRSLTKAEKDILLKQKNEN